MKLDDTTQAVVEKCIKEVVDEYINDTKYFTADSLHHIRSKITNLVHERLGSEHIARVDVGLDLSALKEVPLFFKIDVPKDKAEKMLGS